MEILIGTSGWMYKDWAERFYPEGIKERDKLPFLASKFPTVEINSSFYRMPNRATFKSWHSRVPEGFIFSVKFPRYVTQRKKLILDGDSKPFVNDFIKNSKLLKEHLGAILIQLPPNFRCDINRFEKFIKYLLKYSKLRKYKADFCVEFRHESWFSDDVFSLMRKHKIGFVIGQSSRWPQERVFTTDFSYIRFHGPKAVFASSYTNTQMKQWAEFITKQKDIKRFYVYFNNDQSAKAIDNAKMLQKYINQQITQ